MSKSITDKLHCCRCDQFKSPSEFHKRSNRKRGKAYLCGECHNTAQREKRATDEEFQEYNRKQTSRYYHRHKERMNKSRKEYAANNPQMQHKYKLKQNYQMTVEEYGNILTKQNGVCAICKLPETRMTSSRKDKKVNALAVDHNHISGRNRGLLCGNCNTALGLMKEDIETLKNMISYLRCEDAR